MTRVESERVLPATTEITAGRQRNASATPLIFGARQLVFRVVEPSLGRIENVSTNGCGTLNGQDPASAFGSKADMANRVGNVRN